MNKLQALIDMYYGGYCGYCGDNEDITAEEFTKYYKDRYDVDTSELDLDPDSVLSKAHIIELSNHLSLAADKFPEADQLSELLLGQLFGLVRDNRQVGPMMARLRQVIMSPDQDSSALSLTPIQNEIMELHGVSSWI